MLAPGIDGEVSIIAVVTSGDPCCIGLDQHTRIDIERDGIFRNLNVYTSNSNRDLIGCRGLYKDYSCKIDGDQELVTFCLDGVAQQVNCRSEGLFCGFDLTSQRFDCIRADEFACPNTPSSGRCEGDNTLVRCEYGEERRVQCVNAVCRNFENGDRVACVSELPDDQLQCTGDEEIRLDIANEAKFSTTSGCATTTNVDLSSGWALLLALVLALKPKVMAVIAAPNNENG